MSQTFNHSPDSRSTGPRDTAEQYKQRQRDYARETDSKIEAYQARIDSLLAERETCMLNAADHAGAIGLVYQADSNSFIRIINADEQPPMPEMPKKPAPPEPVKLPRPVEQRHTKTGSKVLEGLIWALVIPVGAYIGYGLGTLTGLPLTREPVWMVAALMVGMAAIAGMKCLFHFLWKEQGRLKKLGEQRPSGFWGAFSLTAFLCGIEAVLGGVALQIYSNRTAFDVSDRLALPVAVALAIAVSTATLLASAVKAYNDGQTDLSPEDQAKADYEKDKQERNEHLVWLDHVHQENVNHWRTESEVVESRFRKQVQTYEQDKEEFSNYKKLPDYQALLKYIGRISVIDRLLDEIKTQKDNYSISRGHGKASVQ